VEHTKTINESETRRSCVTVNLRDFRDFHVNLPLGTRPWTKETPKRTVFEIREQFALRLLVRRPFETQTKRLEMALEIYTVSYNRVYQAIGHLFFWNENNEVQKRNS
jgi:hypothetical protein